MKLEYAKLKEDGTLDYLKFVPNVSNPSPSIIEKYAENNGYLFVNKVNGSMKYHTTKFVQEDNVINEKFVPIDLQTAKNQAMDEVQSELTYSLSKRTVIPCEGIGNIIYDTDALINATGMMAFQSWNNYIDADNNLHNLDMQGVNTVVTTLSNHRTGLYTLATKKRQLISQAETVNEVLDALALTE